MELEDLANILGQDFRPSMKKSAMVYSLADYLRSNPDRWLSHLTERDIRLLESLVKAGPGKVLYLDFPDYLSFLEAGGIIDYDDSDENFHRVWISREVYDIVAPHITRVLKRVEKSGRYEVERVGLGYLNLYGIVPYEMFIDLMTSWWETAGGGDIDRLISHLQESPLIKLNRYHDLYGDYLCTPCMSSTEEYHLLREEYDGQLPFYNQFTVTEAMESGSGAPYFSVGLKTPQGRKLVSLLREMGFDGFELVKAEHDVWMEAQYPDGNQHIFDIIFEKQHLLDSMDRFVKWFRIFADYADSVPKWALKGFSAQETGLMKVNLTADDILREEKAESGLDLASIWEEEAEYPHWSMPEPTVSEGFRSVLPPLFTFGLTIPHVAPDDPCPCNSGLKYRNCHGKNLS